MNCTNEKFVKKAISLSFKGQVIGKFELHGGHLKIFTDSLGIIDNDLVDGDLYNSAEAGDSIIKVKETNICFLKKSKDLV